jgi:hypothetical protein
MVVVTPTHRLLSAEVREELKMTDSLVEGNFTPLKPSIGIRCRFCGLGKYERYAQYDGQDTRGGSAGNFTGLGLDAQRADVDLRVLRCNHCGHVEIFQFRGIQDREWWNK